MTIQTTDVSARVETVSGLSPRGRNMSVETRAPVVWSFFSGAMGLDLGLERAGFHASLAVEIEPEFCKTIALNRPQIRTVCGDVAALSGAALRQLTGEREVDLMVGGPPCQSFSTGGNRAGLNDPRGNAIFEYLRLVREVQPKTFVLENVANLVTAAIRHRPISERPGRSWNLSSYTGRQPALFEDSDGALALEDDELSGSAIRYLLHSVVADMGYAVRFALLDAADYGAPQHRLRFVLLGSRDGQPADFAPPTHGNALMPFATVRDAIADVQSDPGPGSAYTDVTRRYFDLVPAGGNWRSLPPEVAIDAMGERSMNAGGGKTGFFRRLSWDAPSPTVTGKPNRKGSAMCHPAESRPLSVRECARLQGFPDDWKFSGSVAQRYLQIGNAVPVALGWGIGLSLRDGESPVEPPSIDTMLDAATGRLKSAARNKKSAAR